MALIIKKAVDLSSLGDAYGGINLIFRSIPAKDLPDLTDKQEKLGEDLSKVLPFFIEILQTYFIEGTQNDEKITVEDIAELDSDSLIYCFQIITGQGIDPKSNGESTTTSSTEAEVPQT